MVCLSDLDFELLLKNATLKECEKAVMDNSEEAYLVPGGYKVKDLPLMGKAAPVGFSGDDIIFQYTKPCFGFFVLRLRDESEEVKKLKAQYSKDKKVKKIK